MKVENMTSNAGNRVANQFIISTQEEVETGIGKMIVDVTYFQSYDSIIAKKCGDTVILDREMWDYSVTTGKYRNQFLSETKKETQAKIESGEYKLDNLN